MHTVVHSRQRQNIFPRNWTPIQRRSADPLSISMSWVLRLLVSKPRRFSGKVLASSKNFHHWYGWGDVQATPLFWQLGSRTWSFAADVWYDTDCYYGERKVFERQNFIKRLGVRPKLSTFQRPNAKSWAVQTSRSSLSLKIANEICLKMTTTLVKSPHKSSELLQKVLSMNLAEFNGL